MTYRERKAEICNTCTLQSTCGYLHRDLEDDCIAMQSIMYGWELGQSDTIEEIEEVIAVGCDDTAFSNLLKGKIEQLKK